MTDLEPTAADIERAEALHARNADIAADTPMGILGRDEARSLTDEVKADAHTLWTKLLRLYEGKAHKALGYKTWGQFYEAEFGGSISQANRVLAAGRVLESLEPAGFRGEGAPGSTPLNERAARELQPLLRNGDAAVREAYEEAVERSPEGEKPTARVVREVVQERRAPKPATIAARPEPEPARVENAAEAPERQAPALTITPDDAARFAKVALALGGQVRHAALDHRFRTTDAAKYQECVSDALTHLGDVERGIAGVRSWLEGLAKEGER